MRHDSLGPAIASTRRKWTQQERCKRCAGSYVYKGCVYKGWAHCHRMAMNLKFDAGDVRLAKDNQRITCDGKTWQYAELVEKEGGNQ